jgi:L-cystine uptake protein TcyP (sodium:dicarboxylate symporter family)
MGDGEINGSGRLPRYQRGSTCIYSEQLQIENVFPVFDCGRVFLAASSVSVSPKPTARASLAHHHCPIVIALVIVVLLALVSSIGVAGIPAASLVAVIIIMQNAGFSEDMVKASLGLILAIDRPLDMARTAVNVFGDTVGAVVIARSEGETLSDPPSS